MEVIITMRKLIFAVLLVAFMVGISSAGQQDFILYNDSGRTIHRIFVGPSYNDDWHDEDEFSGGGLPLWDGDSTELNFKQPNDRGIRYWDLRVDFADGSKWEWHELDLLRIYTITIDSDGRIYWDSID